ncbi:ABC transporter permease [Chloroflexota bacterium]
MTLEKAIIYIPDKSIKQGYLPLFKEMVREVINSRWLTWQLFRRNFNALYRQSLLGVFWALIIPLISVGTFIFLNASGIFNIGDIPVPYPLFAVAGIALWQVFSMGLTLSANSLVTASTMITKINFPREPLIIAGVAQGIVPSLIQIGVVFVLFAAYQIVPPPTVLLAPLALIPLLFLTLGLGFILSLINGVLRDVGNSLSILVTFLMFLTPVLYAKPASGIAAVASQYNPLYYLVSVPRDLLIFGGTVEWQGYMYSTLFSFAVFFICWLAFHLTETRIAERI